MQQIYNEDNIKILDKDRISVADFSLCLRLQYGATWHWTSMNNMNVYENFHTEAKS